MEKTLIIRLREPHKKQRKFITSTAKRKIIRAGRRSGKTVGTSVLAVESFLRGARVLYAVPTSEQLQRFWFEVSRALADPINEGVFVKNETVHTIELLGSEQRIRAKTAWNADGLRGDYGDLIIFDEYQLMDETAWAEVGAPMLLDNNGDAVFVYTPPSLRSRSTSKARDPLHAAKLWKAVKDDPRWERFHFTSYDNPYISSEAIEGSRADMTSTAFLQEIMAEDIEEVPGALWTREMIDPYRVQEVPKHKLVRVGIGIDPSGSNDPSADEVGIIVGGVTNDKEAYILKDLTNRYSPKQWAEVVMHACRLYDVDLIIPEVNFGGDLVVANLDAADWGDMLKPRIEKVRASRGKAVRAEPIANLYEQGKVHHVGSFDDLEAELCGWTPYSSHSPNRLDALVWLLTALMKMNKSGLDKYMVTSRLRR